MTMRRAMLAAMAALLAVWLAACSIWPGSLLGQRANDGISQTIPVILGQLVDRSGRPVAGAAVRAYSPQYRVQAASGTGQETSARSDASGSFIIEHPPTGLLAIEARRAGDKALRVGVQMAGGRLDLGTLVVAPTGTVTGTVAVAGDRLGTQVFLPGTDYVALTDASGSFTLREIPEGTWPVAAMHSLYLPKVLDGVKVQSGQVTDLGTVTLALDAPELVSASTDRAAPGSWITLEGRNFGESKHTVLQVRFGSLYAQEVHRLSDTEIEVRVPQGVTEGRVVVVSSGVESQPLAMQLVGRLLLAPASVVVAPGETGRFTATALDLGDRPISGVPLTWTLDDPTLGDVAADGTFTPRGLGVTRARVHAGSAEASVWVGVSPYRLQRFAGNGRDGDDGDGGTALAATLGEPTSMVRLPDGSLLVADYSPSVIRHIARDGTISRFAGSGVAGPLPGGTPAREASFKGVLTMALDASGRLWIADNLWHCVFMMPLDDAADPPHQGRTIYRMAGTGAPGMGGGGVPATEAALNTPRGIAVLSDGVVVCDQGNHRVVELGADRHLHILAGIGVGMEPAGSQPLTSMPLNSPACLAVDEGGNVVVGTRGQVVYLCLHATRRWGQDFVAGQGSVLMALGAFCGDGEGMTARTLGRPVSVTLDPDGRLWVLDGEWGLARTIAPSGRCETMAGRPSETGTVESSPPREGLNTLESRLDGEAALTWLGGELYCTDGFHHAIWKFAR